MTAAAAKVGTWLTICAAAADSAAQRPPYSVATFVTMLAGIPVFLLGAALIRNAIERSTSRDNGATLDVALESGGALAIAALAVMVLGYPFFMRRRRLPLAPYLVFLAGALMFLGPMIYWAWWHGQLSAEDLLEELLLP